MCPCGRLLHYSDPQMREVVERLIASLGPNARVTVDGRTWLVPRHYIALHGLNRSELPTSGFAEEVLEIGREEAI